jgi:RHS repeat-associated protein
VWDAEDRLTGVVTPDGTSWRYLYDPLGRRMAKQRLADDGETPIEQVDFTWDRATLCEQTSHGESSPHVVTLTWDHDGVHPLAQTERITTSAQEEVDQRFFAIVTDLVGSPRELIDESGALAWRTRSTLWGSTTWASSSTAYTPLRFPGQYFDPESGLHYNYFRHYDPETSRFLSTDPLGLLPAPNPTTYVKNPLTWADPLGLNPCKFENQMPDELAGELADAERLGVKPLRVGDDGFDEVINSGTVKWAVTMDGDLVIIPKHVGGVELKHPVLTNGDPVRAAGEAEIAGGNGSYFGMEVNNKSGHYKPSLESLEVGKEAFERAGIQVF